MLKAIYMDKRFPGPFYSAYAPNKTTRQDPVYYGGIEGGWNIPGGTTTIDPVGNITIVFPNGNADFKSITVTGNNGSTYWTFAEHGTNYSQLGWSCTKDFSEEDDGISCYISQGGTITIPASLLNGSTTVTVTINAKLYASNYSTPTITVNGEGKSVSDYTNWLDYTWTINGNTTYQDGGNDLYKPVGNEGYTAIVVAVKNTTSVQNASNSWQFTDSTNLINYIRTNISFVKLLTDGLRVNEGTEKAGTIFNCDGTYNKFFILGKGQARKKSDGVLYGISHGSLNSYAGEQGPFKQMFEEFSPTTGGSGDQITDFYSKMMEGATYKVVHDCASVIENAHQFSMSGNTGTNEYALSGLNFYIPDYRLLWWANGNYDGRDMNSYVTTNSSTGEHNSYTGYDSSTGQWAAWFAQYNQDYAPQVGIYKISLQAEAEPRTDIPLTHDEGNRNYKVTLTWHSSLNDMSGGTVPQTYTVYYYDENGNRQALVVQGYTNTNGQTGETTLVYYVEQKAHSYTIDYVVMGTPNDSDHPAFIAWSNVDGVTIPGWDDFVILELDHHESDFVVQNNGTDKANWYRNFLLMKNDVDETNGLTVSKISSGMNTFDLKRYDSKNAAEKTVATLTFDNWTKDQVHFTVTYDDAGNNANLEDQKILADKYKRSEMEVVDQGYFRVKGNGDIIIQPNGYAVNFKAIKVTGSANNGPVSTIINWTSSSQNSLPTGAVVSPSSMWEKYTSGDYYLEGGGYIYIPDILANYTNVTLEIDAYGDGTSLANITVNDHRKSIANGAAQTYTWTDAELRTNLATRGTTRATTYKKVTEFSQLEAGKKYIIVYENGANSYAMGALSNNVGGLVSVSVDNNTVTPGDNVATLTLGNQYSSYSASNYYTLTFDNGDKLGASRSGNQYSGYTYNLVTGGSYTDWRINSNNGGYRVISDQWTSYSVRYRTSGFALRSTSDTNSEQAYLYVEDEAVTPTPTEGGLVRLALLTVDQLKEPIPDDNSHPDTYYYVLRYTPAEGEAKQSGVVPVDIQKTEVEVHGNYSKADIDGDTDAALTMGIISADVTMDLTESDPYILYYQMQGKANGDPGENADWLTQLQQMTSGKYKEMLKKLPDGSDNPAYGDEYDATIHHYYDEDNIITGTYTGNSYFTYAPSVSTWGIDRRYYEDDGEDNTYGGPLWKTGVGDVDILEATTQKQMKQVNGEWVTNPSVTWTEGDVEGAQEYTLYFLSTQAQGHLPKATVSNIAYEPYMFRVFVESASGKLRKYEPVMYTNPETGVQTQIGLSDGGAITGKYCVGSYDISTNTWTADELKFTKTISNDAPTANDAGWNGNMKFGAASDANDLKVYVRFYYMTPGWNTRAGDGPDRPGNGAEKGGDPTPGTGIIELFGLGNGEVVSTTYFNALGIQSDTPFDGLNIIVTRYSDGTTSTTKVIR